MLKSDSLINLVNLQQSSSQMDTLPPEAKRGLTKALVLIGSACEDQVNFFFINYFNNFYILWKLENGFQLWRGVMV